MTKREWLEFLRLVGVVSSVEDEEIGSYTLSLESVGSAEFVTVYTNSWGLHVLKKFLSEHGVFCFVS